MGHCAFVGMKNPGLIWVVNMDDLLVLASDPQIGSCPGAAENKALGQGQAMNQHQSR